MAKNLNIKLVKSLNGRLQKHIATANSLGLRKIGDITVQPDNASDPRQDRQDRLSAAGHRRELRRCESMKLNELSPAAGSVKEAYRKGRGSGSGNGKTAGRGHKGQKARSGGGTRIGFEGGQMPLARRIPKRGFNNIFAKPLEIINLSALNKFEDGEIVTAEALLAKGILSKCEYGYKVLGNGKVTKKVTVQAAAFSQAAKEAIEAAGGKAEVI